MVFKRLGVGALAVCVALLFGCKSDEALPKPGPAKSLADAIDFEGHARALVLVSDPTRTAETLLALPEVASLVSRYAIHRITITKPYDEELLQKEFEAARRAGLRPDLTYEKFLVQRGRPYSREDAALLTTLQLGGTPGYAILDPDGFVLESFHAQYPYARFYDGSLSQDAFEGLIDDREAAWVAFLTRNDVTADR